MAVPVDIPGIGAATQRPQLAAAFDAMKAGISPEEYFVLSRVDGNTTIRDLLEMTGQSLERGIEIVQRLHKLGALHFSSAAPSVTMSRTPTASSRIAARVPTPGAPNNAPRSVGSGNTTKPYHVPTTSGVPSTSATGSAPGLATGPSKLPVAVPIAVGSQPTVPGWQTSEPARGPQLAASRTRTRPGLAPLVTAAGPAVAPPALVSPTQAERAALAEDNELDIDTRTRVLQICRRVESRNAWNILDVPEGSGKPVIKRAYFKLSKEIHPDRYYGRRTGSFVGRLARGFEAVTRAYQELMEGPASAQPGSPSNETNQPQTPGEYAAELYTRGTQLEVHGDPLEAMKLFAAAIRMDPQLRYLRRAASCALAAEQPRTAEEYANKAIALEPSDGSLARLLATAYRQLGKLDAAEDVLLMAIAVPSDQDKVVVELQRELVEVRRLIAEGITS